MIGSLHIHDVHAVVHAKVERLRARSAVLEMRTHPGPAAHFEQTQTTVDAIYGLHRLVILPDRILQRTKGLPECRHAFVLLLRATGFGLESQSHGCNCDGSVSQVNEA